MKLNSSTPKYILIQIMPLKVIPMKDIKENFFNSVFLLREELN